MSTLNICCGICSEFYKTSAVVYSTRCGHLFHQLCLYQWLARSTSCPQCRRLCHRPLCHRVYLNYGEKTAADEAYEANEATGPEWMPLSAEAAEDTASMDQLLRNAIMAGVDPVGNGTYVARVYFQRDLLPASYVPALKGVYTPWNCDAHFVPCGSEDAGADVEMGGGVELLIDPSPRYSWVAAADGQLPPGALLTGYTSWGESLYTGRAQYQGVVQLGKLHPSHHVLYIPYEGREVNVNEYEVLVLKEETDKRKHEQAAQGQNQTAAAAEAN